MNTQTATRPTTNGTGAAPSPVAYSPACKVYVDELKAEGAILMRFRREFIALKDGLPQDKNGDAAYKVERKHLTAGGEIAFIALLAAASSRAKNNFLTTEAQVSAWSERFSKVQTKLIFLAYKAENEQDEAFRQECLKYLGDTVIKVGETPVRMSTKFMLARVTEAMAAWAEYKGGIEGHLVGFNQTATKCAEDLGLMKEEGKEKKADVSQLTFASYDAWRLAGAKAPKVKAAPVTVDADDEWAS